MDEWVEGVGLGVGRDNTGQLVEVLTWPTDLMRHLPSGGAEHCMADCSSRLGDWHL